jgi:holo-[acyl-carrier protein] synthase
LTDGAVPAILPEGTVFTWGGIGVIAGVGVDVVSVARVRRLLDEQGERFVTRVFTPDERAYCEARAEPARHFAARLAAKEAVMKVLGSGTAAGFGWTAIEVAGGGDERPDVRLHESALALAERLGLVRVHLSLSHDGDMALAFAVGESA